MTYVAAFDIGTSTIKAVLVDEHGHMHHRKEQAIPTIQYEEYREQDPESWWTIVQELSHEWWKEGISPSTVHTISLTGQMQDCIPVNKEGKAIRNAILYSDSRAQEEAEIIHKAIPNVVEVTENYCDGSMVFPKLLWLQRNQSSIYEQMHACLVNAKDYIILQLTGQFVADVVTGATTG